jgi:glyoxylase-like metal-dependent hydrolase (beta-lactamase superfamily II)
MIFFEARTPDGWAIPGVHGNWAGDELDGYVQGSVFLIQNDGEALLFDTGNRAPGTNNGMGATLMEKLDRDKVELKYIFISHFHYDHTGNAAELRERHGAEVVAHELDRPIIEDPLIITRPDNVHRFGLSPEDLLEDFNLRPGESLGLSDPEIVARYWNFPVQVDRIVKDGDILEIGNLRLEVIHLPGHSPGHIGIWNPETRSLYCADVIHFPTPLAPHPIGDAEAHMTSIRRCRDLHANFLWEGHYLSVYDGPAVERRLDHLMQMQLDTIDRLVTVLRRNEAPQTILELLPELLPIKTDLNYPVSSGIGERYAYAEACIQSHLRRLMRAGQVERVREAGVTRFTLAGS